ncbi:competence type IV pilus minor pilin ComGF [Bacillus sp. CGMCC 1.16607]|uniref:competence type IV pilus minor pilin ComGF n=1 Tax=Bacillus sp. CGMCC 1.16607 TaxID=3351842 RepID=UPI00362C41F5
MKIVIRKNMKYVNIGNKGFTLLEAILGLAAFCLMAALFPFTMQIINGITETESRLQKMEWEVFSSQIKKEIRTSDKIQINSNFISLTKDVASVTYEQYGTKLRRRVNGAGHEIILQNVKNVSFTQVKNGVFILVKDIWNNNYSLTARLFITSV